VHRAVAGKIAGIFCSGELIMASENQSGSQRGGSGNFANDREKASEAGKKGGQHSHGSSQNEGGGSSGNFANDREKASEAGKKGGEHSHGGR
jgi:general stress protein YciG